MRRKEATPLRGVLERYSMPLRCALLAEEASPLLRSECERAAKLLVERPR